jgi:inosine-uridine nucleoside N-ribohydrolase
VPGSTRLIVITDIGYDPDDMFALAYLIRRGMIPDVIITSDEVFPCRRAALARYVLNAWGVHVPVFGGVNHEGPENQRFISDVSLPDKWDGPRLFPDFFLSHLLLEQENIKIIGLGGFSEVMAIVRLLGDSAGRCELIQMGGALDYSRHDGWIEHNIRINKRSAQIVLTDCVKSGLKVTLVGAQTTFDRRMQVAAGSRIYYGARTSNNYALKMLALHADLFAEEKKHWPMMHDPLTCSVALGEKFVQFEETAIAIDEQGHMQRGGIGMPTIRVSRPNCDALGFMKHLENVLLQK